MAEKKQADEAKATKSTATAGKTKKTTSGSTTARSVSTQNSNPKKISTASKSADAASEPAKKARAATDSPGKSTTTAKRTSTSSTKPTSGTTHKKTATATTKAKKVEAATEQNETIIENVTDTGLKKAATGAKKTTTKRKTATKSSNSAAKSKESSEDAKSGIKYEPEGDAPHSEELPEVEFPRIKDLPMEIPAGELVQDGDRAVSDAHPKVDFPKAMRKSFFVRLLFLVVVIAVLAASAYIYHNRPAVYTEQTSSVNFLYRAAENETVILVNGTERGRESGAVSETLFSGRGDVCAAVIGNNLYVVKGKNVLPIAENVLDFTLSADGDALAYRTAPANLYYRETGKKDVASQISKECYSVAYCLSADGQELVYTATDETGRSQMRVESYSGNRPYIENVVGFSPVAVSDNCRYIYYTDESGALFIFESKTALKIKCATAPDLTSLIFNRDFTEVLFTENGGTVFYADGERQQIIGAASTEYLQLLPNRRVASRTLTSGMQYMISSFYKNYFLHEVGTGQQLTYLNQKGNLLDVSFVDDVTTVTVTDKGAYFLLTNVNNENIHRVLWYAPKGKTVTRRVDWDVSSYCTNIDGSRVMYTGYEDALYSYRAETGSVRLCDSIVADSLTVTTDDLFCFYRTEGVLTVSDNGGELRELATDVIGFTVDTHALYYCTAPKEDGTFTVYVNYRNERISNLVLDSVSNIQ